MSTQAFDMSLRENGYGWWYIDALSDDRRFGLTIIFFVGYVFSPAYRRARQQRPTHPVDFCAVNVALYGDHRRWSCTEYSKNTVQRRANNLSIGNNHLRAHENRIEIDIDEFTAPILPGWPRSPIRGHLELHIEHFIDKAFQLDNEAYHFWRPVAPHAKVKANFSAPALAFEGHAYHDANWGSAPLEQSFQSWCWRRTVPRGGEASTVIAYDIKQFDGAIKQLALRCSAGTVETRAPQSLVHVPSTAWRLCPYTQGPATPIVRQQWEDTPFYSRALVACNASDGNSTLSVLECLDMQRFVAPWVQFLLPYRMRRA